MEEQGAGTSLKCPKCEKMASMPEGGINALPKDLHKSYETERSQYANRIQSKEEISCDQCFDISSGPAVSFCVECCEFICKDCTKQHKFGRKTFSHELVPVGDGKVKSSETAKTLLKMPHKPIHCVLHEDEPLKCFCETCRTLICFSCMFMEHSGHTYNRIEQVTAKHKGELLSSLKSAIDAKTTLDDAFANGGKVMQQIQCKQKSIEEDIRATFIALHDALFKREKCLLAKLAEISLSKQTALTIQGEELSLLRKEIAGTCEVVAADIPASTPTEMLSVKELMTDKLQQLLTQYKDVDLEPCRSDMLRSELDTSELVEKISSFGIVVGNSNPGEAKTDLHLATAVVGKKRKTTITTCTEDGQRFPTGGERVEVTLSLMGTDDPALTAEVLDNKDGTYVASFTPQKDGEHKLSITIDSQHIKGSPFPLYVRQERNYTSLSGQLTFSLSAQPYDVAVHDNGDVYVAVYGYHCIEVYNKSRSRVRSIGQPGHGGAGEGQFNSPSAITIRGSMLYVADSNNNRIQKLTTSGEFVSQFRNNYLKNPRGVCLDKDGRVYVSSCSNNRICVFEADGTHIRDISGSASDSSNLNGPWGLAFDNSGNLHVADTNTNTIKVFTPQGQYVTSYNSRVSQPAGIAIDDEGHTFVAEYNSSRLCILNSRHQVIKSTSLVQNATGVTVDKEGSLYLCGYNNCCVYKY